MFMHVQPIFYKTHKARKKTTFGRMCRKEIYIKILSEEMSSFKIMKFRILELYTPAQTCLIECTKNILCLGNRPLFFYFDFVYVEPYLFDGR